MFTICGICIRGVVPVILREGIITFAFAIFLIVSILFIEISQTSKDTYVAKEILN